MFGIGIGSGVGIGMESDESGREKENVGRCLCLEGSGEVGVVGGKMKGRRILGSGLGRGHDRDREKGGQ